jgi:hypothetical protein
VVCRGPADDREIAPGQVTCPQAAAGAAKNFQAFAAAFTGPFPDPVFLPEVSCLILLDFWHRGEEKIKFGLASFTTAYLVVQ